MRIHVEDLKFTSREDVISWILQQIEQVFEKLKIDWHNFTNCGVRHCKNAETFQITPAKTEYITKRNSEPDRVH